MTDDNRDPKDTRVTERGSKPKVSNLPAISDAILWRAGAADCEMWDGYCHGF
ncbi:hypothetical protein TIFTF001_052373 [Ficus carica]|uniref:Uncharacterized protein n=1 Tax=Ficus carica TaxID=3494 RepID=A0AA88EP43_FICCA|nr:hypothetical protein TIFTF001_052373 [Ficus carica]